MPVVVDTFCVGKCLIVLWKVNFCAGWELGSYVDSVIFNVTVIYDGISKHFIEQAMSVDCENAYMISGGDFSVIDLLSEGLIPDQRLS